MFQEPQGRITNYDKCQSCCHVPTEMTVAESSAAVTLGTVSPKTGHRAR